VNKRLNFGADPDHRLYTGVVFWIRHYWEIRKVVNGHKSAARADSPDSDTGKTCLGEGMHYPSASSGVVVITASKGMWAVKLLQQNPPGCG